MKFPKIKIRKTEYAYIYGSRNVVKDPDNPFATKELYGHDLYPEVGQRLKGLLPKGFIVFGEIVGWTGTTPIQPGFTYQLPTGKAKLYVYRVAYINPDGLTVDLPWDSVVALCNAIGVDTVPELRRYPIRQDGAKPFSESLVKDAFLDFELGIAYAGALPTDGTVDEGVCVRQEQVFTPLVLKAKSPKFFELETKALDRGVADLESVA